MTVFKRNLFVLGLMVLAFSSLFVVLALYFMNSFYYEISSLRLRDTAKTLIDVIGKDHLVEIFTDNDASDINIPVNGDSAYRLTLVAPSGYVLWDSYVRDRLVNHIDREEIKDALEGREDIARRTSISTGLKLIYYALPVIDSNGNVIGVFRLSTPVPGFGKLISPVISPFVICFILIVIAALCAIFAYSRSLSNSLGRIINIVKTGTALLPKLDEEPNMTEFRSLEKSIMAMSTELNFRLERARAESRRLEAILNGMSEAVFAMDFGLKLHLVNPRAREQFNLGAKDISAMSLLEATHSTELENAAKKALASDTVLEMEMTFRTGAEQQFLVFAAPLKGTDTNERNGVVIVMQEVTRLVKLERIRKDFVANVSHELRTPIQLIKGFSETLLDNVSELEKGAKKQIIHFMKIIHKNASVMENLTNDLLVLADLEDSSVNTREMDELGVASCIYEAVSSLEPQAKRKQIEINVNCDNDLMAPLYGSFIIQALINLIDNAIKYSPGKSKIWISAVKESGELVLQVRDKGIGIPSEHLERIFERFYRVDRARSKEVGGTGLGLSIVRHIALLHNGKAEVESHAGEGSTFRIRIPLN